MSNINEKLDRLKSLIQDPNFLKGKGLSNEVNIRIFCYDPEDEMAVRHFTKQLINDNSLNSNIIYYNLYHVFLEICEEKNLTKKIIKMEEKKGSNFLKEKILKFSTTEAFTEKMQYEPHKLGDVLLLTGVGEVFPFMRVHSLLDELQIVFDDIPIVVLYPGSFNGRSVTLFNEFKSNEYYRAFNII